MIACSVSVPPFFNPRRDWRRMEKDRRGVTLTLPSVMERRMTATSTRLRRVETRITFLKVTIFISPCNEP
jgi:hypothetical protein